jgi:4-hydroxy-3-polyprenylbenzoate decarboxylase
MAQSRRVREGPLTRWGKLVRVTIPINKDTEFHPLVRLQFRGLPESERKAFLFENVYDSNSRTYDTPILVGAMAGSAEIYPLGVSRPLDEIHDTRWNPALGMWSIVSKSSGVPFDVPAAR